MGSQLQKSNFCVHRCACSIFFFLTRAQVAKGRVGNVNDRTAHTREGAALERAISNNGLILGSSTWEDVFTWTNVSVCKAVS